MPAVRFQVVRSQLPLAGQQPLERLPPRGAIMFGFGGNCRGHHEAERAAFAAPSWVRDLESVAGDRASTAGRPLLLRRIRKCLHHRLRRAILHAADLFAVAVGADHRRIALDAVHLREVGVLLHVGWRLVMRVASTKKEIRQLAALAGLCAASLAFTAQPEL